MIYTAAVLTVSTVYFIYAYNTYPPITESETFLSEIGEGFGEVGLWALLCYLNRTHVYVGIATVAVILLHIVLMGVPMEILFFPAVLVLVVWQGIFRLFLTWRYSPKELKKFSHLVHAQFVTGIMIGLFAYFGHLLVD